MIYRRIKNVCYVSKFITYPVNTSLARIKDIKMPLIMLKKKEICTVIYNNIFYNYHLNFTLIRFTIKSNIVKTKGSKIQGSSRSLSLLNDFYHQAFSCYRVYLWLVLRGDLTSG